MELSSDWTTAKSFYKIVSDLASSKKKINGRENKKGKSIKDMGDTFMSLSRGYTFPASRKD